MLARGAHGIGTSWIEKKVMGEEATSHDPARYDRPEYARVRWTRNKVRALNDEILNGQREDVSAFPQKMYFGRQDRHTCRMEAQDIAQVLGMDTQGFDADHFTIMHNQEALTDILRRVHTRPLEEVRLERRISSHEIELRGLGFALQGGAGTLDPGASLA